ncbi:MAG TPA: hypothetical protein ENK58_04560 [Desulfobacterales bacterium]|nr:hypothetical protein [Desulfobacterales bacterium]
MEENQKDNTLSEILEEDIKSIKRNSKRRSCIFRLMIISTLLFLGLYGFVLFRQHLLNLEAEAIISAGKTATAQSEETRSVDEAGPNVEFENKPTESDNPLKMRTATISVMLTSVAEFQLTQTPE